jgi:hypothetical protein
MNKMKRKAKQTIYKVKVPTPPQTKPYGWQTPIPHPQISKSKGIKGFGENVDQPSLGVYVSHLNVPLLYMISQKVMSPLNVSSFCGRLDFLLLRWHWCYHT